MGLWTKPDTHAVCSWRMHFSCIMEHWLNNTLDKLTVNFTDLWSWPHPTLEKKKTLWISTKPKTHHRRWAPTHTPPPLTHPGLRQSSYYITMYSVSQKIPLPRFSDIFFQNGQEFLVQILHGYCTFLSTLENQFFNQLPATLTKLCHIRRDHHNVLKMSTTGWNAH